jgi:glycosyltransferase involved in cell wall biosynthesis
VTLPAIDRKLKVIATAAQGPTSPAFRIRVLVPAASLQDHGVSILAEPLFTQAQSKQFQSGSSPRRTRILVRARRDLARSLRAVPAEATTTLIQRQVDMLPFRRLERLAIGERRLVLDVDDAIWLDRSEAAGGHRLAFFKDSARKLQWLAKRADVAIAGNEFLADWLSDHAPRVAIVPSLVDVQATPIRRHAESRSVVWGWIGSPSSAVHLRSVAELLGRAARGLVGRDVRLLVVGAPAPVVPDLTVNAIPWSEAAERHALALMDIGIMPLRDTAWTRGKCAYKALQYMSAGIPVVCDDVGVSAAAVGHQEGGLVVRDRTDWIDALRSLSLDLDLRSRLGVGARQRVEREFSLERWTPKLASILRGEESPQLQLSTRP